MRTIINLGHTITLFGRVRGPKFTFENEADARQFCETLGVDYDTTSTQISFIEPRATSSWRVDPAKKKRGRPPARKSWEGEAAQ